MDIAGGYRLVDTVKWTMMGRHCWVDTVGGETGGWTLLEGELIGA